jgi:hypothetical protein
MVDRRAHDRGILALARPALGALAAEPLYVLVDTAMPRRQRRAGERGRTATRDP